MSGSQREVRDWERGTKTFDNFVTESFKKENAELCAMHGRDALTYTVEQNMMSATYWDKYESPISHGYPYTSWLQLGLMYGCGIYTAQEQGVIKRNVFVSRFWKFHWFDWITFLKRSTIIAGVGGFVAGTVLFGNSNLALRRAKSRYTYLTSMEIQDPDNKDHLY
jgi:hypothetical protein